MKACLRPIAFQDEHVGQVSNVAAFKLRGLLMLGPCRRSPFMASRRHTCDNNNQRGRCGSAVPPQRTSHAKEDKRTIAWFHSHVLGKAMEAISEVEVP